MSLYDNVDTVKDWNSKPSTSSIKLLQDHLQVKKTTSKPINFKPIPTVGQKRPLPSSQPVIQHISLNHRSSYSFSPLGGDWDMNNEYNPFQPNDYEKVKARIYQKQRSMRKEDEPSFVASLGLSNYEDDDEDEEESYRRSLNKPRSGATFAPPPSLRETDNSSLTTPKSLSQSSLYSSLSSSSSKSKILDPVANMMAKMGYQPGQGLGREKQGITSALQVEKTGMTQGKIVMDAFSGENDYDGQDLSRVVMLRNMVGPDEVDEGLEEEIKEECKKYGLVLGCSIFQVPHYRNDEDAVRIFVEFSRTEYAVKALNDLSTRYFAGRKVLAEFYNEKKFYSKCYM